MALIDLKSKSSNYNKIFKTTPLKDIPVPIEHKVGTVDYMSDTQGV